MERAIARSHKALEGQADGPGWEQLRELQRGLETTNAELRAARVARGVAHLGAGDAVTEIDGRNGGRLMTVFAIDETGAILAVTEAGKGYPGRQLIVIARALPYYPDGCPRCGGPHEREACAPLAAQP